MPKSLFGSLGITLLLLFIVLAGGVKAVLPMRKPLPGDPVPKLTAKKLVRGEKHGKYLTNPPTSGWYIETKLRDGFHTTSITDEEIVGALHQGKIAIVYNCQYGVQAYAPTKPAPSSSPGGQESTIPAYGQSSDSQQTFQMIQSQNKACAEIIEGLRSFVKKSGTQNIILFPYNKMETRVALLSWGRIEKLMWLDETRVRDFIEAYRRNSK